MEMINAASRVPMCAPADTPARHRLGDSTPFFAGAAGSGLSAVRMTLDARVGVPALDIVGATTGDQGTARGPAVRGRPV